MSGTQVPTCDELLDRAMREVQAKDAEIERLKEALVEVSRSNNDLAAENQRLHVPDHTTNSVEYDAMLHAVLDWLRAHDIDIKPVAVVRVLRAFREWQSTADGADSASEGNT